MTTTAAESTTISTLKMVALLDSAQLTKELIERSAKRRKGPLKQWEKKLLSVAEKALSL